MRSLKLLAARLGCPSTENYLFDKAIIDSRKADQSSLFFALPGKNTDGHEYVKDVLGEGGAAVVSRDGFTGPVLEVDSVEEALLEAGSWARDFLTFPVVGVTGSSGKTTTRRMLAAALSVRFKTDQTSGNLNNHLGLPLTLLNTSEAMEFLVLEMGMNHHGELLRLGWASKPDHALITNIGRAHMEFFDSKDEIAHAKSELLQTTSPGGVAVVPAGEEILIRAAKDRNLEVITHGEGGDCWLEDGRAMPWGIHLALEYSGEHNMSNAVSAMAFSQRMGVNPVDAAEAISQLKPPSGRGQTHTVDGFIIVDESYNANPDSTIACLKAVVSSYNKPVIAVLGDMLELGERTDEFHREVLKTAEEAGYETLITVGRHFRSAAEGMNLKDLQSVSDWKEALEALRSTAPHGSTVLVKGSNSVGLSRLVEQLRKEGF